MKHKRRLVVVAVIPLAALFLLVAVYFPKPSNNGWKRYVSPTMTDGMRFTFLYPSMLTDVRTIPASAPRHALIWMQSRIGMEHYLPKWSRRVLSRIGFRFPKRSLEVRCEPYRQDAFPAPHAGFSMTGQMNMTVEHQMNTRYFRFFTFKYMTFGEKAGQTQGYCRKIRDSLRVLAPGEAVPSP